MTAQGVPQLLPTQSQTVVHEAPITHAELEALVYDNRLNGFIGHQSARQMRRDSEARDLDGMIEGTRRRRIELDFDALVSLAAFVFAPRNRQRRPSDRGRTCPA